MRKLFLIATGLVVAGLVAAPLALSLYLPSLAERQAIGALHALGFNAAAFENIETRRGMVILNNVKLDDKGFSGAQKIEADYSWAGFLTGKLIQTLTIDGLSLTGEYSEDNKLSIAGWEEDKRRALFGLSAIKAVNIQNGRIDLMVESFGGVNIKFDLLLRRTTLGGVEFKSAISGTQSVFSADARLSGSMNLSGEWNADLEIDEGKIDLPAIKATRVSGNGSIAGGPKNPAAFIMQLSAGGVILFNLPWHNVSATAEGNAEHYTILCEGKSVGHEGIEFTLNLPDGLALTNLSGSVHTQKFSDLFSYLKSNKVLAGKAYYPLFFDYLGPLSLDFLTQLADDQATPLTDIAYTVRDENGMMNVEGTGKIDQKTKIVTGNLSMPSMPVDGAAKGGIAIDGSFQTDYTDGNLKTKGKLKANLSDAVFSVGLFEFRNVNANLAFNDLASFSSDGSQKVTFALPLKESVKQSGKASLSIQNGKKIRIEGPALDIFGGKIAAADLALGAEKEVKNILLTLTSINLGDVSTALTIDGLSLEGRLKGSLPIKFKEGKAYIEDGILSNDGDGTIHFTPSKIPTFLQGDDISLETARMALENYRYDFFEVRMNGPLKENMDITINARGHNPDLFEKRPVAINLNTSAALGPLFSHILEDADDDEVEESH